MTRFLAPAAPSGSCSRLRVAVLEKATVGIENTSAASFSLTRSIRNDYLEPLYARLAHHARRSWLELERKAGQPFLIECGCLNLVKRSITSDPDQAYATRSYRTLRGLHLKAEELSQDVVRRRFPQFDVDQISFYQPPDAVATASRIRDVQNFVDECMPGLGDAQAVDMVDVDQCACDMVSDDDFILGALPRAADISVGVGWRGTGYKYAPWVGETLAQLALQGGTVYDIDRLILIALSEVWR